MHSALAKNVCHTADSNNDKLVDFVDCFKDGKPLYRKIDSNFDGQFDQFTDYKKDLVIYKEDRDHDGKIDKILEYDFKKKLVETKIYNKKTKKFISIRKLPFKPVQPEYQLMGKRDSCKVNAGHMEVFKKFGALVELYNYGKTGAEILEANPDKLEIAIRRMDLDFNNMPYKPNFDIGKECYEVLGKDIESAFQDAIIEGAKCLAKLGTPTARLHLSKLNSLLLNRRVPIKLRCNLDLGEDIAMLATIPGDSDYPQIQASKNVKRDSHDKTSDNNRKVKNTLFHEVFHLLDVNNTHGQIEMQDYTVNCDVCCSKRDKENKIYDSYVLKVEGEDFKKHCKYCGDPPIGNIIDDIEYVKLMWKSEYYYEMGMKGYFNSGEFLGFGKNKNNPKAHCKMVNMIDQLESKEIFFFYINKYHDPYLSYPCKDKIIKLAGLTQDYLKLSRHELNNKELKSYREKMGKELWKLKAKWENPLFSYSALDTETIEKAIAQKKITKHEILYEMNTDLGMLSEKKSLRVFKSKEKAEYILNKVKLSLPLFHYLMESDGSPESEKKWVKSIYRDNFNSLEKQLRNDSHLGIKEKERLIRQMATYKELIVNTPIKNSCLEKDYSEGYGM